MQSSVRRLKGSYIIFNNKEFKSVFYKFHLRVSIDQRKKCFESIIHIVNTNYCCVNVKYKEGFLGMKCLVELINTDFAI